MPPTTKTERQPNCGISAGRQQAAERRPDREAAEHDHHHGGAAALRIELRGHGDGVGHGAAEPEPGQKANREQRADVVDERGGERADAEGERREDDDLLAPDAIGERAEHQRADHQSEQAGAENRAERALGQAPFLGEHWRDITDGLGIEAVEEQHRGADQEQADLESADRLMIDKIGDIDARGNAGLFLRNRHRSLSQEIVEPRFLSIALSTRVA